MKVLLAGATGAIGRPLVRRLVAAGHEVVGLTRRPDAAGELDGIGARGAVCDVFDRAAVLAAAQAAAPDAVLDQTTDLPQRYDPRRMDLFCARMAVLRTVGAPNLREAARLTGARFAMQSVAFLYAPGRDGPRRESDPPYVAGAPSPWSVMLPPIAALERQVVDERGLVLRYGFFYGPGTHYARGGQVADAVAGRRMPVVGSGAGTFSFIHVEDAASATVAAVDHDAAGILNVVDDEPLPMREWVPALASALGAKRPWRVPAAVARLAAGPLLVYWATRMPGASNARPRETLGWAPERPSARDGFAEAVG